MQVKPGYLLKKVADKHIVVPTNEATLNLNGLITLNESAKILFEALLKPTTFEELVELLVESYEIDQEEASSDVNDFLNVLRQKDLINE